MFNTKPLAAAFAAVFLVISAGCQPQTMHPNQINTFDGVSYDSLTAAHAALLSLRTSIAAGHPQYVSTFNQAAGSYETAYQAYVLYRAAPADQTAVALALCNLTVSIISLENTFQADMHASPKTVLTIRRAGLKQRRLLSPHISISDILSELAIAASIAASVPGTQPYSLIAELVIRATQQALAAIQANSGQPIQLALIQPVPTLS